MPDLPSQPNLDHLRHQARRLLRDAQAGDPVALERIGAWSTRLTLSAAQLAVAREYGWRSWDALRHYVEALASIAEHRHSPPTAVDHEPSSGVPTGAWRGKGEVVLRGGTLRPGTLIGWGSHGLLDAELASSLLARRLQGALDTVLVTDDGAETDLDLGHYERFIDRSLSQANNITSGRIYQNVINKERRGDYLRSTLPVIPHLTDESKGAIPPLSSRHDVAITESGATPRATVPSGSAQRQANSSKLRPTPRSIRRMSAPVTGTANERQHPA